MTNGLLVKVVGLRDGKKYFNFWDHHAITYKKYISVYKELDPQVNTDGKTTKHFETKCPTLHG